MLQAKVHHINILDVFCLFYTGQMQQNKSPFGRKIALLNEKFCYYLFFEVSWIFHAVPCYSDVKIPKPSTETSSLLRR
jgi:hypothetical protein